MLSSVLRSQVFRSLASHTHRPFVTATHPSTFLDSNSILSMAFLLDQPLRDLFSTTTSSVDAPSVRSLLVQSAASAKKLELVQTLGPSADDKSDFESHLSKLFSNEPTRSGYALFRLDSRAANGDWEWLCVAYQPDGAKVREKMQYTMTRTALLAGLNEQHFLDTIFASGPKDFVFPTKLRNSRKHDYQNPQQKTAGRPASEAAGTDAGGARRNFAARGQSSETSNPAPLAPREESQASDQKSSQIPASGASAKREASSPLAALAASTSDAPPADSPTVDDAHLSHNKQTPEQVNSNVADTKIVDEIANSVPRSAAPLSAIAAAGSAAASVPSTKQEEGRELQGSIAPSKQDGLFPPAPQEEITAGSKAAEEELTVVNAESADDKQASEIREQAAQEQKAPEEPPTRASISEPPVEAEKDLSKPLVPSPETAKQKLDAPDAPITKPQPEASKTTSSESKPVFAGTASDSTPANSSSSRSNANSGSQAGGQGGGASTPPAAPPKGPFALEWTAEAEAAISGLGDKVSGSAEHNFVPLFISPKSKSVEIRAPPRFVPPGDLKKSVKEEASAGVREEHLVLCLYRYPIEVNSRKVAFIYSEMPKSASVGPISSSFYAATLEGVIKHSEELSGLEIERDDVEASYGPHPRPNSSQVQEISDRINSIRYRIEGAAKACGRSKNPPRLVAVSKLHPPSSIMAAHVDAGQDHFGENYVQELVDKAKVLPESIKWHFVGGLQSNKGKALASIKNLWCVETLDSIKAANVLEKALSASEERKAAASGPLRVYLQVNTSGEEAKSGVAPLEDAAAAGAGQELIELAEHVVKACPNLLFAGLMTIGSAANSRSNSGGTITDREQALEANPDFAKLDQSRTNIVQHLRNAKIQPAQADEQHYAQLLESDNSPDECLELSMGMTADFEVAIAAGSANVRIGTACFGERPASREEARKGMESELTASATDPPPLASSGDKGFAKPKRPGQKR